MRRTALSLAIVLFTSFAWAEYRTYKLGIRYSGAPKEKESVVVTTLDDLQYPDYFKVSPKQYTRIIQHWMCYGRTDGYRKPCSQPPTKKDFPDPLAQASLPPPNTNSATPALPTTGQPSTPVQTQGEVPVPAR